MDKVIRKISGKDATVATIISTAKRFWLLRMWTPLHTENGCVNSGAGGGFAVMLLLQAIQKRTREKMASGMGTVNFHVCRYVFGIIRIERRMEG